MIQIEEKILNTEELVDILATTWHSLNSNNNIFKNKNNEILDVDTLICNINVVRSLARKYTRYDYTDCYDLLLQVIPIKFMYIYFKKQYAYSRDFKPFNLRLLQHYILIAMESNRLNNIIDLNKFINDKEYYSIKPYLKPILKKFFIEHCGESRYNIGRIYEASKNIQEARKLSITYIQYHRLNNWTNLEYYHKTKVKKDFRNIKRFMIEHLISNVPDATDEIHLYKP